MSNKSNCLLGAIIIRHRFGGKIEWCYWIFKPKQSWPWNKRLKGFRSNPWGHYRVRVNDHYLSYSSKNKNLPICNQLWFSGYIKRKKVLYVDRTK